ncbi:hypothetical protein A3F37_02845 [Candidatus Saccharibacteria bacterium RIFCSPHIGHO2_12_FULL_41_12]|nr:MAG: hypothetical protein A3F37_02845 [Candidatus Saccharibacteria bacterium RIFCSPHIGHO2_12_FULL_41_12]
MIEAVDKRWYIGYSWWITLNAIIVIVLSLCAMFVPSLSYMSGKWGMTLVALLLATITILYRLVLYNKLERSSGLNFATFIYSLLQLANLIHLINVTGWSHSWYFSIYLVMCFFCGMIGLFPTVGAVLITTIYMIIMSPQLLSAGGFDWLAVGAIALSYIACIMSYFAWRNQYIDQESQKIVNLKGEIIGKEKQAEMLIQSIADGIIVIDNKGDVTLINKKACEIVGWPKQEALGFDGVAVLNIMQDNNSLKSIQFTDHPFRKVLSSANNYSATVEVLNRDNTKRYVSLVISPVVSPQHNSVIGAIAVLRDVSDEKKQEQQRAEFISTASHEMRTPVAAIEGYLALAMNDKVSSIDAKAREYLDKAHASTQHLGKLFQDLLTSAKAEDGRLTSHPVPVEMRDYIEKLSQDLQFSAQKKGLEVELIINTPHNTTTDATTTANLQSVAPVYFALIDPDRIREVITNVFDNATKYTDSGKISIGLSGDDKIIQIFVKDTGPGIPKEDIKHLFQKFYRVDNTATRTVGGTGLGLFICQKIVELYGGTIWAESTLNVGSTFFINLPRLSNEQAQKEINKQDLSIDSNLSGVAK